MSKITSKISSTISTQINTQITTKNIRRWVYLGAVLLFTLSLGAWFLGRDRLPRTIRIATGNDGGLYYKLGEAISPILSQKTNRTVKVEVTAGSESNYQSLLSKEVELAIIQAGSVAVEKLAIVTPLFPDYMFFIVRRNSGIDSIVSMDGHHIALGPKGSGMRKSALQVLSHFAIKDDALENNTGYFMDLLDDPTLDGAIVTTGIENDDLKKLLDTNEFDLLPIPSAPAIAMAQPFLRSVEIPEGLYGNRQSIPPEPIPTLATTAYLVARPDASRQLVRASLEAVHEESLRLKVPTLISRADASQWVSTRLHSTAHDYFHPADNMSWIKDIMESINATKELLVALGTGFYLLWLRWRRLKAREADEFLHEQKDRLDWFLQQTLQIEKSQMTCKHVQGLQDFLDEVTAIKLQALRELTEEGLRGDQAFSIFLDQCAGLRNKIQLKILSYQNAQ
ncbi:MAG: TAXI family TRAP transporter solute-binding subunit [Pirellulaceae bacterium]